MISKLQNEDLAVTIPGFYDRVENLSKQKVRDGKGPFFKGRLLPCLLILKMSMEKKDIQPWKRLNTAIFRC